MIRKRGFHISAHASVMNIFMKSSFPKHNHQTALCHCKLDFWIGAYHVLEKSSSKMAIVFYLPYMQNIFKKCPAPLSKLNYNYADQPRHQMRINWPIFLRLTTIYYIYIYIIWLCLPEGLCFVIVWYQIPSTVPHEEPDTTHIGGIGL